jgi:hypothetical protein
MVEVEVGNLLDLLGNLLDRLGWRTYGILEHVAVGGVIASAFNVKSGTLAKRETRCWRKRGAQGIQPR